MNSIIESFRTTVNGHSNSIKVKRLEVSDNNTIALPLELGSDFGIYELSQIDREILMTKIISSGGVLQEVLDPHLPRIVDYEFDDTITALIMLDSGERYQNKYKGEDYLSALRTVLKNNSTFILSPNLEIFKKLNTDLYNEKIKRSIEYTDSGSFDFFIRIAGNSYGDLFMQLDKIIENMEMEVSKILNNK